MRKLIFLTALLVLVPLALAQTPTGTIEGTVLDPSGASVAGATATITNNANGSSKQITADGSGRQGSGLTR